MTLCIGVASPRGAWIGADSGSTLEHATEVSTEPKLWRSNGWLVASAGNWRALEIMRYDLDFPEPAGNPHRALAIDLHDLIAKAFERNDFELERTDGGVDVDSAYWLLAARDHSLWHIDFTGHVERKARAAIGVGTEYAIGLLDCSEIGTAETRIRRTLKKVATRYRCIVGPYLVERA